MPLLRKPQRSNRELLGRQLPPALFVRLDLLRTWFVSDGSDGDAMCSRICARSTTLSWLMACESEYAA